VGRGLLRAREPGGGVWGNLVARHRQRIVKWGDNVVGKGTKERGVWLGTPCAGGEGEGGGVQVAAEHMNGGAGSWPGGAAMRDRGGHRCPARWRVGLAWRAWAGRGRREMGQAQGNITLLDLFKIFQKDLNYSKTL
jgi:hypothetical protein